MGVSKDVGAGNPPAPTGVPSPRNRAREIMRSCLLYMIGVPIPVIILIWLLTGHA